MSKLDPKIARSARRLRIATFVLTGLYLALVGFTVWVLATGRREAFPALRIEDNGLAAAPTIAALLIIGVLIGLALLSLTRMLRRIEEGAPFAVAADLRRFAL